MPSLRRHIRLAVLLALLLSAAPAARPAFAQSFTVTQTGDTDDGSTTCPTGCTLRKAMRLANESPGPDTISFNIPGAGPHTISPATQLPTLGGGATTAGNGTTIDGTNLATNAEHTIVISGALLTTNGGGHGFVIRGSEIEIRDLVIGSFGGSPAATDFEAGSAIFIDGSLSPSHGDNNRIFNNWIGVAPDGVSALNNSRYGVRLGGAASGNQIGGTGPGQGGNVIAAGGAANIGVGGASETGLNTANVIAGNFIGTNVAGTARPTNVNTDSTQAGINIDTGASGTTIVDNLIGGMIASVQTNTDIAGVFINGEETTPTSSRIPTGTTLLRNLIGVNPAGTAIPNRVGVVIGSPAEFGPYNTAIGDQANPAGGRNVIAGNTVRGIEIIETGFKYGNVTIAGNYIGLTPGGAPLPNGTSGSSNGGEGVFVGRYDATQPGTNPIVTVGPGNVISSNITFGVRFRSGGHVVRGNYLGTDVTGSSSTLQQFNPFRPGTANGAANIWIENGNGVTIGGASTADRNVISFSGSTLGRVGVGVLVDPEGAVNRPDASVNVCGGRPCSTSGNTIRNNYIGINAAGTAALNPDESSQAQREGVRLYGTNGNTLQDNVISGNGIGVAVGGLAVGKTYSASNNVISGNRIGTGASGATTDSGIGNREGGILVLFGSGNQIAGNLVAFNGSASFSEAAAFHGILVGGPGTSASGTQILGNRLIRNGNFGAGNGVHVDTATGVTISRTETSGNEGDGIRLANGGNAGRAAPTVSGVSAGSPPVASGTGACNGCVVEVFASPVSEPGEGPVFIARATATGLSFSIPVPGCLRFLTATVTDTAGNTSPFSPVFDSGAAGPCVPALTLSLSTAAPSSLPASPGSTATYTHRLTHNVQVERTYTIVYTSTRGWASAPAFVTVPAAPANGTAFADFNVAVSVPLGTPNGTVDETQVQAVAATLRSEVVTDRTTAQAVVQTPAAPAVSPGQTKPYAPGTVTFTHAVTNTGDLAGTFEVVSPQIVGAPAGFSIASATLAQTSIPGKGSTTLTIVVNTPATPPAPGNVTVRFAVGVVGGDKTPTIDDTIVVAAVRSFTFTPEAPQSKPTPPGADVSFDYVLTNTGNAADSFSVTGAATGTGNPLTFVGASVVAPGASLTNLAPGASTTVRVTFRVPSGAAAVPYGVSVTASAAAGAGQPAAITRTATVTVTGGGSATILPGAGTPDPVDVRAASGLVTFTNTVTNTGNAAVPITVPTNFNTGLPAGWTATTTANTCNATATIQPGATCTFTVQVSVPQDADAGSYDVRVTATADNSGQAGPPPSVTAEAFNRVNILRVRGVELAPDRAQSGLPGEVITFTHTLTNTGNGADSFDLALAATTPGWSPVVTPTAALDVPRGATRTITVTARVPAIVLAGTTNTFTVTATGRDGGPSDSAVDTATVAAVTRADLSPGRRQNLDAGETVTYTHTLTNTGTTAGRFSVAGQDSAAGWTSAVAGSPTAQLAPGGTATITVTVTAPASASPGVTNTTTLRVFAEGTTTPLLDDEEDVTVVGPAVGVLITPDNTGVGLPRSTALFTHTVTNIGTNQGLFALSVAEANGWPATVTPNLLNLGGGQSFVVEVRVIVPDGTRADEAGRSSGFARVTAQLVGDPTIKDDATDTITVGRVSGVNLSSSQVRKVNAGGAPQQLSSLLIYNTGNAFDTFTLSASGLPQGWGVTFAPSTVPIDKDSFFRVALQVTVPAGVQPGTTQRIFVEARSQADSTATDTVELTLVYDPPVRTLVYLPLIRQGGTP